MPKHPAQRSPFGGGDNSDFHTESTPRVLDAVTSGRGIRGPPEEPFGGAGDTGAVLLPARRVLQKYSITDVTLWRWVRDGVFPPPDKIINRRRYWWDSTLAAFDREAS